MTNHTQNQSYQYPLNEKHNETKRNLLIWGSVGCGCLFLVGIGLVLILFIVAASDTEKTSEPNGNLSSSETTTAQNQKSEIKLIAAVVMIQGDALPSQSDISALIVHHYPDEKEFNGYLLSAKYDKPITDKETAKEDMYNLSMALLAMKAPEYLEDKHEIYKHSGVIEDKLYYLIAVVTKSEATGITRSESASDGGVVMEVNINGQDLKIKVYGFTNKPDMTNLYLTDAKINNSSKRYNFAIVRIFPADAIDPIPLGTILSNESDVSEGAVIIMIKADSLSSLDDTDNFEPIIKEEAQKYGIDIYDRDFLMSRGGKKGDFDYQIAKFY